MMIKLGIKYLVVNYNYEKLAGNLKTQIGSATGYLNDLTV